MPAHKLGDANNLILKSGPYKKVVYIAKRSFQPGPVPSHLTEYAKNFTEAAKACSAQLKGMPAGKEHVLGMRACIGGKLKRGR